MPLAKLPIFLFLAFAFLSACAAEPAVVDPGDPPAVGEGDAAKGGTGSPEIELCDAGDYRHLIGTNIKGATFPVTHMLRVYGVNDIVTQEYIPQRTNIVFDAKGTIVRVGCG